MPIVDMAGKGLRAPWAAGIAGIAFAVLFTATLLILRTLPIAQWTDAEVVAWFAAGEDGPASIAALYLAPFAGVAFLWFIAVIRDQIGEREDRFFATVFFGGGILFVALFFAAAGVAGGLIAGARFMGEEPPSATIVSAMRSLAYVLLFSYATRAAGVFIIVTATIGLRSGTFPRWFSIVGYAIALVLLVVQSFWDWTILIFPAWVAFVSLFILRRERSRSRSVI